MNELTVEESTMIKGLLHVSLPVFGDSRGWFKENYQERKLKELGLPEDFDVVQNNISFNEQKGVTRGIHAEPWDKYISIAYGEVFAALVDLRANSSSFGKVQAYNLTTSDAIYVPRGVGNSFQTLKNNTVYTYLVNDHWSEKTEYTMLNLSDSSVAVQWPIPLDKAIVSDKDKNHPFLDKLKPMEV